MARSRAVYRMPPEAPTPSKSGNQEGLTGLFLVACGRAVLAEAPAQPALDERVDIPVQHGLGVPHLEARPDVFDERVRLQNVVADLGSELGGHDLSADLVSLRRGLLLLALEEPRL